MPYNQAKNPVKYMKSALKMEKEMKKMGGPLQYGSPMDMDHEDSPAKMGHEGSPDEYYKLMSKEMDKKN